MYIPVRGRDEEGYVVIYVHSMDAGYNCYVYQVSFQSGSFWIPLITI